MREKVLLICQECLSRNYQTTINKERSKTLEINKYCPKCGMDLTQPLFHVHYDVEPDDTEPEDGIRFNWRDDEQE